MDTETKNRSDKVETKESPLTNGASVMEIDVSELSSDLDLPKDVQKRVVTVLQSLLKHKNELKDISREELNVCAVYMAIIDARMPYGPLDPQLECGYIEQPVLTLTDFLTTMGGNIPALIKSMNRTRSVVPLSDAVKHHLKHFEKKYCIVSALLRPFKKLCCRVFTEESQNETDVMNHKDSVEYRKSLCWTLFVLAKSRLLTDEQIVDAFCILVCCLEYILRSTPTFQLNSPFNMVGVSAVNSHDGRMSSMLQTLAEEFNVSYDEVRSIQENRTEPFIKGVPHEGGELDLDKLTELYLETYRQDGDINELLFLKQDPHLLPSDQHNGKVSPGPGGSKSETCMTPIRSLGEMFENMTFEQDLFDTRLRTALNTVQKLKTILTTAEDEPSETLLVFFENCSTQNPAGDIAARVRKHQEMFTQSYVDLTGGNQKSEAKQRFTLAQRLYYRVMEAMLQIEKERLSKTDFSKLLNVDAFHKSLLACSVEIVLMTYGVSWDPSIGAMGPDDSKFSFPWILEVFDIQPYNFSKVLESFIRAEPVLTRDIIQHLQNLEIKILECLAWKANSPVFEILAEDSSGTEAMTLAELSSSSPSVSSADLYLSPMRPPRSRGVIPSPRQSQGTSAPVLGSSDRPGVVRQSHSLTIFLKKVSRLGYNRLQMLCGMLHVPKDLQHKIWTCFEHCITKKPALLKNRHLDQVMLCSIYGICKVGEKEIKFKTIVERYRDLPHAEQHIYKSALIKGKEFDSVIGFYNKVFMQNMKNFILQFSTNSRQGLPPLSPVPKSVNSPLASPVYSIPSRKGFYVSPLKDSPFKPPQSPSQMTPNTRQLYCFGEGLGLRSFTDEKSEERRRNQSAEKLKQINETLSSVIPKTVTPGRKKRLRFDQMNDSQQSATPEIPVDIKKQKIDGADNGDTQEDGSGDK